jgi:predicted nucleic acid-binding protein
MFPSTRWATARIPESTRASVNVSLPSARLSREVRRQCTFPSRHLRDALIGAIALVHGMTLVTRNVKDFARFDWLDIIEPWHRQ